MRKRISLFQVFLLVIVVLTMYNNLEHSASVYYQISYNALFQDWYNHMQSYLVVIVIDLSVIAFILAAKERESVIFAWVLFVINCLFFNVIGSVDQLLKSADEFPVELVNHLLAKLIFSGIFSYSLHRFSSLWNLKGEDHAQVIEKLTRQCEQLREAVMKGQIQEGHYQQSLLAYQEHIDRYDQQLNYAGDKLIEAEHRLTETEAELSAARQKLSRSKKTVEFSETLNN